MKVCALDGASLPLLADVSLADDGVAPLDIPCKVSEARLRCMVGTSVYANFASAMPACAV